MRSVITFFREIDPLSSIGFGGFMGNATSVLLGATFPCLEERLPHIKWFMFTGAAIGFFLNYSADEKEGVVPTVSMQSE